MTSVLLNPPVAFFLPLPESTFQAELSENVSHSHFRGAPTSHFRPCRGYTALYNHVSVQRSVTHQIVRLNVLNNFCVGRVSVKSLPGRVERVLCAADARSRVRTQSGKRVGGVLER